MVLIKQRNWALLPPYDDSFYRFLKQCCQQGWRGETFLFSNFNKIINFNNIFPQNSWSPLWTTFTRTIRTLPASSPCCPRPGSTSAGRSTREPCWAPGCTTTLSAASGRWDFEKEKKTIVYDFNTFFCLRWNSPQTLSGWTWSTWPEPVLSWSRWPAGSTTSVPAVTPRIRWRSRRASRTW